MSRNVSPITFHHSPELVARMIEDIKPGQFAAVTYLKKDGTLRYQVIQSGNDAAYCVGSERGQKASATFHKNNPTMLRRRDVRKLQAYLRQCKAEGIEPSEVELRKFWRTIDCSRVYKLRRNGVTIAFKHPA